jgi:hypothetical protein
MIALHYIPNHYQILVLEGSKNDDPPTSYRRVVYFILTSSDEISRLISGQPRFGGDLVGPLCTNGSLVVGAVEHLLVVGVLDADGQLAKRGVRAGRQREQAGAPEVEPGFEADHEEAEPLLLCDFGDFSLPVTRVSNAFLAQVIGGSLRSVVSHGIADTVEVKGFGVAGDVPFFGGFGQQEE